MDIQKDFLHTTELHRSWGYRCSRTKRFFASLACYALVPSFSLAHAHASELVACPAVSPSEGVYSASKIYRDSIISVERNETDQTISLSIYRASSSECEKTTFAKYSIEGGAPNVDSLFFLKLQGKLNIFAIVHWDVNSRGIGTYGKHYKIYAYIADEQGRLIENRSVVDNVAMTGMDGYEEGVERTFPYKTAGAVKSFFKCHKAKCKWQ